MFTRNDSIWSQQAYLKASNTAADDRFGQSVAIAGETLVVGANNEDSNAAGVNGDQSDNSVFDAGAAYVFTRSASSWSQQAYLKASNPALGSSFGSSVAIAGDILVIGASFESSNATGVDGDQSLNLLNGAGAAYVFKRNGTSWNQQAYLKAFTAVELGHFGTSVAITGDDTVVVGAFGDDSNARGVNGEQIDSSAPIAGAAYVFNLVDSTGDCTLDVDDNLIVDALTDGLMLIRYLFGSRNEGLTLNAVATNCIRCSTAEIEPILEQCATASTSDIDGNGEVDALTDGLLMIRYLFGIRGDALIKGSVANNCSRCNAPEIEVYLQGLAPLVNRLPDPATDNQISGVVWLDSNGNDVQDNNEPGAELITVTVTDESIPITRSTYTASNGYYEFTNLPPVNSYRVSTRQDSQLDVKVSGTETAKVNLSVGQLRNIIKVDSFTCSLQDAINSSVTNLSIGGCRTGIETPNGILSTHTLLDLNPESEHLGVELRGFETQFGGSIETEIKGNGSIIDEFSLRSSDAGNPRSVVLRDLIIGKVNNSNGALTLDQVTVENTVIQRGLDSFADVFNSTIGSFDVVTGNIHSSTVHGDTNSATVIDNSTIDGTVFLDTFSRNSRILKNSTVAELAVVVEQQPSGDPRTPQLPVKIEESRINSILINNFDAVIPEKCYLNAGIFSTDIVNGSELTRFKLTIDPQCLIN